MPRIRDGATLPAGHNGHAAEKLEVPQRWKAEAACHGEDQALFFPQAGARGRAAAATARAICAGCPVQLQCLAFALANGEEYGIWGGTTERERRAVRALLDRARAARVA